MEQDALAVSRGFFKKPYIHGKLQMLRNLQILQIYRLTDLYDFRSPGAHPRTRAVYNTKRCGEAGALARVVQECWQELGGSAASSRSHARTREEGRGGGACKS